MTQVTLTAEVILSEIHKSLCLIVKTKNLLKRSETTAFGLAPKVRAEHVIAMSNIYVDDYLTVGPAGLVDAFMTTLRKLTIEKKEEGLLLHQHNYTEDLLKEHASRLPARKRTTTGDPEHFKKMPPPPPNPSNPEHHPKDPSVLKILRVVNLLCVVFLVRRGDLLSRAHLVWTPFSWELQTFFLSKKGPRRSKFGGRSKNTTA